MSEGYAPDDFAEPLRKIEASQLDYFVEGGQAVNIWAEVCSEAAPGVIDYAPFTSKDFRGAACSGAPPRSSDLGSKATE